MLSIMLPNKSNILPFNLINNVYLIIAMSDLIYVFTQLIKYN